MRLASALVFLLFAIPAVLWFGQPTIGFGFGSSVIALLISGAMIGYSITPKSVAREFGDGSVMWFAAIGAVLMTVFVTTVTTAPMFHASAYQSMIGKVNEAKVNASLPPLQVDMAPLVDERMAYQAAQKKLSADPGLGSSFEIDTGVRQIVNGKMEWVFFIQYRGFFAWLAKNGTPGYITVSTYDAGDVHMVTEWKGQPIVMRYMPSAYMGDDLERHAYLSYMGTGLTDFTPEVADDGHPILCRHHLREEGWL